VGSPNPFKKRMGHEPSRRIWAFEGRPWAFE